MNIFAIIVCAILSMVVGALWYGPLFGKTWMRIIGVDPNNKSAVKRMQNAAGPLYFVQFVVTIFEVFILATLIEFTQRSGLTIAFFAWAGFVVPSFVGALLWNNQSRSQRTTQLLLQGGYQLVIFMLFGLVLQYWS